MKRTELKRKAPLKSRGPTERKSALSAGRPMQRKPMARRSKPRRQAANDSRWRSEAYLAWVRQQPCCRCGAPADDAHHVIGLHWGLSGMGTTAPDSYAMPVCRACHRDVHRLPELQRYQPDWLRHTIARGVRRFDGKIRAELVRAWEFIDEREAA